MPIAVENRARLTEIAFAPLRDALEPHATLERALAWMFAHDPPLSPSGMVGMDEFSYDLVVPLPEGLYLSYDTN